MKLLITGGTGFIGTALCRRLISQGHQITVLTRDIYKIKNIFNSGVESIGDLQKLPDNTHFDVIINLAGAPIMASRWSLKRKKLLLASRVALTKDVVQFIARTEQKPELLISASAIGYYGNQAEAIITEESDSNVEFSHHLCVEWEHAAKKAEAFNVRVCLLRIGLVIGDINDNNGGFLKKMIVPFKLGIGGRIGSGQQWMSWIHRQDLLKMIETLINQKQLRGIFNATAPTPVTNAEFTQTLSNTLNRYAFFNVPAFVLKIILGEMSTLILGGQRVIPKRFLDESFHFKHQTLKSALDDVLN